MSLFLFLLSSRNFFFLECRVVCARVSLDPVTPQPLPRKFTYPWIYEKRCVRSPVDQPASGSQRSYHSRFHFETSVSVTPKHIMSPGRSSFVEVSRSCVEICSQAFSFPRRWCRPLFLEKTNVCVVCRDEPIGLIEIKKKKTFDFDRDAQISSVYTKLLVSPLAKVDQAVRRIPTRKGTFVRVPSTISHPLLPLYMKPHSYADSSSSINLSRVPHTVRGSSLFQ